MKKHERAVTAFEKRVYDATRRVPRGRVTTYKLLAQCIGCGSSQAVGQALKDNPYAPRVPCHRVIRTDLSPGGFAGHAAGPEVQRKLALLRKEGVLFHRGRLAQPDLVFSF